MGSSGIKDFTNMTIEKIRDMVDANTVVGTPINCADGTSVIPVSQVQIGFASGGMDLNDSKGSSEKDTDSQKGKLGGGSGGGVKVSPVAFIVVSPTGGVKLMQIAEKNNTTDRALNLLPDIIDQISNFISKKMDKSSNNNDDSKKTEIVLEEIE